MKGSLHGALFLFFFNIPRALPGQQDNIRHVEASCQTLTRPNHH
ncbi:hypothetical protein E2C01_081580 [Portunus trituberculatus]|uniref:Uncharacterized protein n=1 Tax=Portunus trituberculatus TaxID=210409 RepID=A0A5B7J2P7_PORTR|nr:hypothetical protein [Portunus trituberculatus]